MTDEPQTHNIDVGIRTIVMQAAKARVHQLRVQERQSCGVPQTTMASVGRAILNAWRPDDTNPAGEINGHPVDAAGNRLTERGHRKYEPDASVVPQRGDAMPDEVRVHQLLNHLRQVSDPARGSTLGPIAAVRKAARAEGLLESRVGGKSLDKHLSAAERAVLKPLRFTLPEASYQRIAERMADHSCTVTRALEIGLQRFAKTGEVPSKVCGSESCPTFARTGIDPDTSCVPLADGTGTWKTCPHRQFINPVTNPKE